MLPNIQVNEEIQEAITKFEKAYDVVKKLGEDLPYDLSKTTAEAYKSFEYMLQLFSQRQVRVRSHARSVIETFDVVDKDGAISKHSKQGAAFKKALNKLRKFCG